MLIISIFVTSNELRGQKKTSKQQNHIDAHFLFIKQYMQHLFGNHNEHKIRVTCQRIHMELSEMAIK